MRRGGARTSVGGRRLERKTAPGTPKNPAGAGFSMERGPGQSNVALRFGDRIGPRSSTATTSTRGRGWRCRPSAARRRRAGSWPTRGGRRGGAAPAARVRPSANRGACRALRSTAARVWSAAAAGQTSPVSGRPRGDPLLAQQLLQLRDDRGDPGRRERLSGQSRLIDFECDQVALADGEDRRALVTAASANGARSARGRASVPRRAVRESA